MAGSHQAVRAEPNLTPILDMVFQLITFFMLVMNFKAASVDTSLQLPVLGSALPAETGETDILVLNILSNGKVRMYGRERDVESCVAEEAQAVRRNARAEAAAAPGGGELPTTVVIRADRTTPYHLVHQAIRCCQMHGFRNFQYRALSGEA